MGPLISIILRLITPLSIIRWPFAGGIASIIADSVDWHIISFFNRADLQRYQNPDKLLDLYYLSVEMGVVMLWKNKLVQRLLFILFFVRFAGIVLFEYTKQRYMLVIFPNLFEWMYLFYLGYKLLYKREPFTSRRRLVIVFLVLLVAKMIHEYAMHIVQLDFVKWLQIHSQL